MRTTPAPDLDAMVDRGQDRQRRRNTTRFALAAAAVLLVAVGGVYGVAQVGDGDSRAGVATAPTRSADAAKPPTWPDVDQARVTAGTYRAHVGVAADGRNIDADLTIDGSNWRGSNYPVAYDGAEFAGIGAYQPTSVAGGCKMQDGLEPAAVGPDQLAQQLAGMPQSEVVQQPTPTTAFGHEALHLRMRVNAACGAFTDGAAYQVAQTPAGARGISYFDASSEGLSGIVLIDFWVLDVNGTTVVVDMFHTEGAPRTLVDQAAAARESITFVAPE